MADPGAASGISISDQLSAERTRLSHDRTLMSNIRTSTALISFGFTIYKFFEDFEQRGRIQPTDRLLGSRNFAFLMLMIGVVYLVLSAFSYTQTMKRMRERYGISVNKLPLSLASMISLLGVLGLLAIIFRQ